MIETQNIILQIYVIQFPDFPIVIYYIKNIEKSFSGTRLSLFHFEA